jgi:hypothetical protein
MIDKARGELTLEPIKDRKQTILTTLIDPGRFAYYLQHLEAPAKSSPNMIACIIEQICDCCSATRQEGRLIGPILKRPSTNMAILHATELVQADR